MYTLADFARIEKTNSLVLPMDVKQVIQTMCKSVGVQPVFTVLAQTKTSMQDAIREINKLTEDNRSVQIPLNLDIVSQVDVAMFADVFFQMVWKNPFCSKTYVALFQQLQLKWPVFTELFEVKCQEYLHSFETFVSVDQDQYDLFCEWKAENDRRRTFTLFLANATLMKVIPPKAYDEVVHTLMTRMEQLLSLPGKEEMNEWVENLFVLKPTHSEIVARITEWTTLKLSDHPGLSYKIIFRLMDILK